jgi:hypothetical protein
MTDQDLPGLFHDADEAAKRGQRRYVWGTAATLILSLVAAFLGVIELNTRGTDWAAVGATAAFVLAIIVGGYLLAERPEQEWYEGRAAAESAKTLAWRYAVGATDFPPDSTAAETEREFLERLREIASGLKHVELGTSGAQEEISQRMQALREEPFTVRRNHYRSDRVQQQRDWYADSSSHHGRAAIGWRLASLSAQFVGVVGGILKATGVIDFDFLGIAAAGAAAAVAWLQTREHATLANAYSVTARELSIIDAELEFLDEDEWGTAVDNAERAISREHTLWKARRTDVPDTD